MSIPFYLIDAFSDQAFAGNPAAVCLLDQALPDERMHQIAQEFNQAETAFVLPTEHGYNLRWRTPVHEVDLCGHATLAAAHALWHAHATDAEQIIFSSRSGDLSAVRRDGQIFLNFPRIENSMCMTPPGIAEAIGAMPFGACKAGADILVELGSADAVRDAQVNIPLIKQLPLERGLIICAQHDDPDYDIICRFFAPAYGIDEDQVTGSAHCALAPYFQARFQKEELRSYQASKRGGSVSMRFDNDRILLGGQATIVASGNLHI